MGRERLKDTDAPCRPDLTLGDIRAARDRIASRIRATPLVESPALGAASGAAVYLKLEHQQITGSFKLRGATNAILGLTEAERARGVVGVSTGNHGRGLAHAAKAAGARCIICMSSLVPRNKVEGIESLGAEVRIVGDSQDDAQIEVDRLVSEDGMVMLPPFRSPRHHRRPGHTGPGGPGGPARRRDDPGAAVRRRPDLRASPWPRRRSSPPFASSASPWSAGAAMYQCQRAGKPITVSERPTLADSLGGGIGLENRYTFALVRDLVDDLILVDEAQIAGAIRHAYWEERQIVEGSGARGHRGVAGRRRGPRRCHRRAGERRQHRHDPASSRHIRRGCRRGGRLAPRGEPERRRAPCRRSTS